MHMSELGRSCLNCVTMVLVPGRDIHTWQMLHINSEFKTLFEDLFVWVVSVRLRVSNFSFIFVCQILFENMQVYELL